MVLFVHMHEKLTVAETSEEESLLDAKERVGC